MVLVLVWPENMVRLDQVEHSLSSGVETGPRANESLGGRYLSPLLPIISRSSLSLSFFLLPVLFFAAPKPTQ